MTDTRAGGDAPMTEGLTVAGQAERLCRDEATIRSVLTGGHLGYTLTGDQLTGEMVEELDSVLNPLGVISVPELYGYTGEDV